MIFADGFGRVFGKKQIVNNIPGHRANRTQQAEASCQADSARDRKTGIVLQDLTIAPLIGSMEEMKAIQHTASNGISKQAGDIHKEAFPCTQNSRVALLP